jgi:hypothetical protein
MNKSLKILKENKKKWLCYFAHPYIANVVPNLKLGIQRTNELLTLGYNILSPIVHSHYLEEHAPRGNAFWYGFDLILLEKCDCIILAPEWESSNGCLIEQRFCEVKKIPIYHYEDVINI